MLVTEMSPSRAEGQPVEEASPATALAMTEGTYWALEDKTTYFIKKLDALLRVRVERPRAAGSQVAHLMVANSRIPQAMWKRLLVREEERKNHRIRERQALGDRAECVVVRVGSVGA